MFGHRCVYCRVINFDHAQIYVSQSVRSSVSLSAWLSVSLSVRLQVATQFGPLHVHVKISIYNLPCLLTHTHVVWLRGAYDIQIRQGAIPSPKHPTQCPFSLPLGTSSIQLPGTRALTATAAFDWGLHMCARYVYVFVCVCVWRNFLIYFLANGSRPSTFQVRVLPTPNKLLMEISKYWFSVACKNFYFPSLPLISSFLHSLSHTLTVARHTIDIWIVQISTMTINGQGRR